jgi:hypothetical protein
MTLPTPEDFYEAVMRAVLAALPPHRTEDEAAWFALQQGLQFLVTPNEHGHPQHHDCVLCEQHTTQYHVLNPGYPHRLLVFPLCASCQDEQQDEQQDALLLRMAAITPLWLVPSPSPLAPSPGGHATGHDRSGTHHDPV